MHDYAKLQLTRREISLRIRRLADDIENVSFDGAQVRVSGERRSFSFDPDLGDGRELLLELSCRPCFDFLGRQLLRRLSKGRPVQPFGLHGRSAEAQLKRSSGLGGRPDSAEIALRATCHLGWLSYVVPRRVHEEEIGDAVEFLYRLEAAGSLTKWGYRLKIATTIFWVLVNAMREIRSAWMGKFRGGK